MAFHTMAMLPFETLIEVMVSGATTPIRKLFVSLKAGVPLSVTRTVTALVVPGWATVGFQTKSPSAGPMVAPGGAPGSRLKVSVCGGKSGSVAEVASLKVAPAWRVWSLIGARTGGLLTIRTAGSPRMLPAVVVARTVEIGR